MDKVQSQSIKLDITKILFYKSWHMKHIRAITNSWDTPRFFALQRTVRKSMLGGRDVYLTKNGRR
jgi:hypothetical protein